MNSERIEENKEIFGSAKDSNLKVGDLILLMTKISIKNDTVTYRGVISADGVISKSVALIPKDSQHGANVHTRSCLFRIENARKVDPESSKIDSELMMAIGKSLTYGERVQLRHWHSKGFLNVNTHSIALEAGCLEIYVSELGNEDSWFEIQPVNKLRKSGEVVKYNDSVYFKCSYEKSAYFLHFNQMSILGTESKTEVNACGNTSFWQLKKYMSYELTITEGNYVTTGDSFRIFHKISEGYLSVSETKVIQESDDQEELNESQLYVQKGNKSSNSLWELQRLTTFVGGIAKWEEDFRIKHLATGYFLKKEEKTLKLSQDWNDENCTFRLIPQSITSEKQIRFGVILSIRNSNELVKVEYQEETTKLIEEKSKEKYKLSFAKSKKDYSAVAFVLEDVPEVNTEHVYKLSLMIPRLIDAYNYLKDTDLLPKALAENPEKESILRQTCKQLQEMLSNVRKSVIHSNNSEVDIIKRQNSMREMGVIDALIKLADHVECKIQLSMISPKLERDISKLSYKSSEDENANIVVFYLNPLEENIFQLVYESVKNNPKNCKVLIDYEDKIVPMLSSRSYHQIGKILREMFKFVLELTKYSEKRIDKWFSKLQEIRLGNTNIKSHSMYLNMMKYLCQSDGMPTVIYQAQFKDKLFSSDNTNKIIKFHVIEGRPCIELDYNRKEEKLKDILYTNHYLSGLQLVKPKDLIELHTDLVIFYLEDLCHEKDYRKYVSSAIEFYASLCLGRYNDAIEKVKESLHVTSEFLLLALNSKISNKLKASFIELLINVFIDVDPYIPISEFKLRCFAWVDGKNLERMDKEVKPRLFEYFFEVVKSVEQFWNTEQPVNISDLSGQMRILTAYLKLTKFLLDLDILQMDFLIAYQKHLLYLVMGVSNEDSSWCNSIVWTVKQVSDLKFKHSLSELLEEVMKNLQVMIIKRENLHVENLCRCFTGFKKANQTQLVLDSPRSMETNFQGVLSLLEWKFEAPQQLSDKKSVNPVIHHLDIYLLKLLFNSDKSVNKEVRKKALELILADLNLRNTLKQELMSVEFLINQMEENDYVYIFGKSKDLDENVKRIVNLQAEKLLKQNYYEFLKSTSVLTLDILKTAKQENQNPYLRGKFQAMLRHTNIITPLLKIIQLQGTPHKILYRSAISLLYHFAFENIQNQEILIPYVDIFLDKIENGLGVAKLLAQVLSTNKKLRKGNRIIKLIFKSIDRHEYEYHLLQLLRTFLFDENNSIVPKMQIDILKWIFNNNSIKKMHLHHSNHYDYLDPILPDPKSEPSSYRSAVKFHSEVMKCINICAYKNRFGMLQGRKLITLNNLFKTLKKSDLNKSFKKAYLKFLYEVYMTDIPGSVIQEKDINSLEEILKEVIIKDLEFALESMPELLAVCSKGVYSNIPLKKHTNLKLSTFALVIAQTNALEFSDEKKIEEKRESKLARLNEQELKVYEHWNYLSGCPNWHSEKEGLLHILRDMFLLGTRPTSEVLETLKEIRGLLKKIGENFEIYEKTYKKLDFSNIIFIVNTCREAVPTEEEDLESDESQEIDGEIKNVVLSLREAITDRKMSLEEVFTLFDSDKNGNISMLEFKNGIKSLLKLQSYNVEKCFNYFAVDGVLRLADFSLKMRKYFYRNNNIGKGKRAVHGRRVSKGFLSNEGYTQDNELLTDYNAFIDEFSLLCKDQDINDLVSKIKITFVDKAIQENDNKGLTDFVSKLGTAFKKKYHKKYLLQILKLLVPENETSNKIFDDLDEEKREKLGKIKKTQEILSQSGVLELALSIISNEHELELIDEAVKLIISLLRDGNQKVQEKFLDILKKSDNSYLFSYIRLKLRQSRDRIVDRAKNTYEKNPEKAMAGKIPNQALENYDIEIGCALESPESIYKAEHVTSLIKLLQLCCENCYSDFQHYIRSQEMQTVGKKAITINMVNEIAQYLINIKEVGPELVNNEEASMIIPQCYETLIDLCRGPCVENQLLLGQRRKLYKFIESIITDDEKFGETFFNCAIRFLKSLLEGECNKEIAIIMIEEINFEKLSQHSFKIYKDLIHYRREILVQERVVDTYADIEGNRSERIDIYEWEKINSGFDIVILFLKLGDKFPDSEKLKSLSCKSKNAENVKPLLERIQNLGGRQESLFRGIYLYLLKKFKKEEEITQEVAYEFYLSLLASVEIDRGGVLEQSYFRISAMIVFLSETMRDKLLYQLNRNSHEEKVKSIFQHSELCQIHMYHLQQLSRFKKLTWWSSKSSSLADISFILIVLINIILLFSISSPSDNNFDIGDFPGQVFLSIFGVIVIILSLSVYLLFIVENFPVILYEKFTKPRDKNIYNLPSANKLQGTVLVKYYAESTSQIQKISKYMDVQKVLYIMLFPENLYNLIYVILVCVAWKTVFVYPFLLLDIVRRNENLRNILKAVTQNKKQLGLTVLLGLIIVYLFSVIAFLEFEQYAQGNCDTLLSCVTYALYYGVRAGGGIGDNLDSPTIDDPLYGYRQLYDLLFFIIVIIILLNIIFGIIIDTFGELRDQRKKIEEDVENICIICGREKYEFELRGSGWNEHIQLEHNLFSYLGYIIYVRRKPLTECDGLEKFVKGKIEEGDIGFIPKTAMCLEKGEKGEQNNMLKDIDTGIREIEELIAKIDASNDL